MTVHKSLADLKSSTYGALRVVVSFGARVSQERSAP
jgi:hypothetical protein